MMNDVVQIKYSKVFAIISVVTPISILVISGFLVDFKTDIIFTLILFGSLAVYSIFKFFLPMLNKKNALELNPNGIYDFVRNQHTSWTNIRGIKDVFYGNGSALGVLLYNEEEFLQRKRFPKKLLCYIDRLLWGTPFLLPFQYLQGNNDEIFETVQKYYAKLSPR